MGKRFGWVSLFVVFATLVSLWAGVASAADPVTLTLWVMPNGADPQAAIDAEIAAFNAVHPEITVKTEVIGWGDAYGRIQAAIQGGEGPDITQLGTTWVPTFGAMGGLRPFTAEEIKAMGGAEGFIKASWDTAMVNGEVVSVPWFADVRVLAYRKDFLEKAGVNPDEAFKTLDSFVAALEKVKAAGLKDAAGNDVAPFLHPGRNDWNVWQNASVWIWAYGGDLLSADGKKAVFNSDQAVQGVTQFDGLYGKGLTPSDTLELNSAQSDARFGEGAVATYLTGPWVISQARDIAASGWITDAAQNLAFAPFPAGPGGQYTFVGGSDISIMKSSKNPAAAVEFIKFLVSNGSQISYSNAIGMLPATVSAQNDKSFTSDAMFVPFVKAAPMGKSSMNISKWGQVENNLQTALQSLWEDVAAAGLGKTIDAGTVKTRLDEAAATVDALLAE